MVLEKETQARLNSENLLTSSYKRETQHAVDQLYLARVILDSMPKSPTPEHSKIRLSDDVFPNSHDLNIPVVIRKGVRGYPKHPIV